MLTLSGGSTEPSGLRRLGLRFTLAAGDPDGAARGSVWEGVTVRRIYSLLEIFIFRIFTTQPPKKIPRFRVANIGEKYGAWKQSLHFCMFP